MGKMNYSVAVIGSGPAGLACAEQLTANGFKVTVFDELKEFGGMIAYGIPEFRIPLKNIRKRILTLKNKKIDFQQKKITSIKKLLVPFGGKFDFAVIAIGAGTGMKAGFKGEQKKEVIDALEFLLKHKLKKKKMISKGEEVAIIGGGNSAMDAARVAVKQGGKTTIIYRRTELEMPALKSEIEGAKKDGVKFEFLKAPVEFKNNSKQKKQRKKTKGALICSEIILGEADESGRKKPIDSGKKIECFFDKIIIAIGQEHNLEWLEKEGIKINGRIVLVDSDCKTSIEKVYACGDAVTGAKTIGEAIKSGLIAAKSIIALSSENNNLF